MDGLLVIAKPVGPTSHDVVARMRRLLGERRIGHTGTLDPRASGVLPLVIGRATRLARFLSASDKSYEAVIRLGYATTTGDSEGTATAPAYEGPWPSRDTVEHALHDFRGTFRQRPPAFSAKKIDGMRSYHRARLLVSRGAAASTIDAPPEVEVHLRHAVLVAVAEARATVRIECSAGFYVRSLARDLGERLGTGAHLESLVRTQSGGLTLDDAMPLAVAEDAASGRATASAAIIPLSRMLPEVHALSLTAEGVTRAVHGQDLRPEDVCSTTSSPLARGIVRLLDSAGDLVGIAAPKEGTTLLHPFVVLV
jgi:tRNA pseudouridine55 synthase